jgi:hypothetical protein
MRSHAMTSLQAPALIFALSVLLGACVLGSGNAQAATEAEALPDIAGDWVIASSVGGATPITVYCTLEQNGSLLSGSCTPEMENAEPSALNGSVAQHEATWGYGVVFNGAAGTVDFRATTLQPDLLEGTLSLSGTEAPFTAQRK